MKLRPKESDEIKGFLDQGTHITGELAFAGTLRIDGNFHGSISTDDRLVVGTHAIIHADIKVGEIEIAGKVLGSIEAKRSVEILPTGRVQGDIHTPVLVMSPGSMLDARTCMAGTLSDDAPLIDRTLPEKAT